MKIKKFQYSKILPLITGTLFTGSIIKCFSVDITTILDVSLYAAIITSTGASFLTSIVWYLKNSQAEKVARIKAETYKIISEERFKYNARMLALQRKHGYTDEEIADIENDSPLDELEYDALNSMNNSIDNAMDEATAPIEIQSV